MKPLETILQGNAAVVGLEVLDPFTHEPPPADATLNITVTVREEDGTDLPSTIAPLDGRGPWVYAIRFLPPAPGPYYVRVEVAGDFDAAGEGRVNVSPSRMPAAA